MNPSPRRCQARARCNMNGKAKGVCSMGFCWPSRRLGQQKPSEPKLRSAHGRLWSSVCPPPLKRRWLALRANDIFKLGWSIRVVWLLGIGLGHGRLRRSVSTAVAAAVVGPPGQPRGPGGGPRILLVDIRSLRCNVDVHCKCVYLGPRFDSGRFGAFGALGYPTLRMSRMPRMK